MYSYGPYLELSQTCPLLFFPQIDEFLTATSTSTISLLSSSIRGILLFSGDDGQSTGEVQVSTGFRFTSEPKLDAAVSTGTETHIEVSIHATFFYTIAKAVNMCLASLE